MKKSEEKTNKINKLFSTLALATATVIGNNLPAQALYINFTYGNNVNWYFKAAAETAAIYWEDRLRDDATVNIHLDMADASKLPAGTLAGTMPAFVNNVYYNTFRNALINDRNSGDDYTAVANLPETDPYHWNGAIESSWKSGDLINLTRANAKALNLIDRYSSELDAVIVMSNLNNTGRWWETNRLNSVESREYDFTSVLIHEMGHALGFVNVVDSATDQNTWGDSNIRKKYITPLDLFTKNDLIWNYSTNSFRKMFSNAYGYDSYFSIDGGYTNLGNWSTGANTTRGYWTYGDGWQASHWRNNNSSPLGIMNASLPTGIRRDTSWRDLTVLDVMGWNIDPVNWSTNTIVSWGQNDANWKGNTENVYALNNMFNQYRWGGGSSSTSLAQGMDLTQFLAQQGLFQQGTFWSFMDETEANANAVPEPNSVLGLLGLSFLGFMSSKKSQN